MNIPTFVGLAAAFSLAAIAGVLTWRLQTEEQPQRGLVMVPPPERDEEVAAELARLRARVQELELQRQEAVAAVPQAQPVAGQVSSAAGEVVPVAVAAVAFPDERYAEVLAKIDWQTIGRVTKEMQPLLLELVAAMEESGDVPKELELRILELNSQLVSQVPLMMKSGLPGFGPNGSYTHPLFVANGLASTLAASGQPLDEVQLQAIGGLVKVFGSENEAVVARAKDFDLEHLLAEVELKDRFYSEVVSRLTPQQQASLFPSDRTEYDGINLFGTGLMTRPYAMPVSAKSPADFARKASNRLGDQLGLDEAGVTKMRSVLEGMATRATELWNVPANATEQNQRMLRSGRTTAALRFQLEALRAIQQQVPLSPGQREKLGKLQQILVPLPL